MYSNNFNVHAIISKSLIINVDLRTACLSLNSVGNQTRAGHLWLVLCARIYIYPVFRESKSKTLVFTHLGFFAKTRSINFGTEMYNIAGNNMRTSTDRLEIDDVVIVLQNTEAGVLKKLSLGGLAKLSRVRYSLPRFALASAG